MSTTAQNKSATVARDLIEWDSATANVPNGCGTAGTLTDLHAANIARQAE
jgi:hypothetical protein